MKILKINICVLGSLMKDEALFTLFTVLLLVTVFMYCIMMNTVTNYIYNDNLLVCSEGEFRLVSQVLGNRFTVTGVLEVCINGSWTSVCSDSVEFDDPMVQAQAEITCDGLGYTGVFYIVEDLMNSEY